MPRKRNRHKQLGDPEKMDEGFLGRAEIRPFPSRLWACTLPERQDVYGPVRVLDGSGREIRVISVEELGRRSNGAPWPLSAPQGDLEQFPPKKPRRKGKYSAPQMPDVLG